MFIKLFESYKSQKDLEYLTKIILKEIAERTLDELDSNLNKIRQFKGIKLKVFNPNIFSDIKELFDEKKELLIVIINPRDIVGGYNFKSKGVYLPESNHILLKEYEYTLQRANEIIKDWDYDNTDDIVKKISEILYREYSSVLIHELQHAYDDARSGGKAIHQSDDYVKRNDDFEELSVKSVEEMDERERELFGEYYKEYLNLKHELDARFAEVIQKIDFYEYDLEKSFDENKDVFVIKPFKDVYKEVKYKDWFKFASEKDRKRIQRKLSQFYHFEKELVDEMNAKSVDYDIRKKNGEFGGVK